MLAVIQSSGDGYTARFERHYKHSVEKVWAFLTENGKLQKWFAELRVEELREGGRILFDMGNGTFEEMRIIELRAPSVLEYTWADDRVRFELYPEGEGCRLVLIETLNRVTDHTPRDLAGWHVCLDVIGALLDEQPLSDRKQQWERWYAEYAQLTKALPQT